MDDAPARPPAPETEPEGPAAAVGPAPGTAPVGGEPEGPVKELRVAVTVGDFEAALRFYRDVLGLPVVEAWDDPHDRRGVVLAAGRATLELLSPAQTEFIDEVETGDPSGRPAPTTRPAPPVRLAIEVGDSAATAQALVQSGADHLGGPVVTPWQHRNVRLRAPDGMQLTLFTVLDSADPEASPH